MMEKERKASICIIEQPVGDLMLKQELREVLGGWNCGSYSKRLILKDKCQEWDKTVCSHPNSGENYCGNYTSILRKH